MGLECRECERDLRGGHYEFCPILLSHRIKAMEAAVRAHREWHYLHDGETGGISEDAPTESEAKRCDS